MSIERTNDSGIAVRVTERERDPICSIHYMLTRALVVHSVQPTEMFRNLHRELESEGALDPIQ